MKEHPILFSTAMVEKILSGEKTETRRLIKPQPEFKNEGFCWKNGNFGKYPDGRPYLNEFIKKCPLGFVGDHLWVRETWIKYHMIHDIVKSHGGSYTEISDGCVAYKADGYEDIKDIAIHIKAMCGRDCRKIEIENKWRPSIHMPRWASRITLEITNINVERLQDITDEGAVAEGFNSKTEFILYWNKFCGKKRGLGWFGNPYVWVIKFKRIK